LSGTATFFLKQCVKDLNLIIQNIRNVGNIGQNTAFNILNDLFNKGSLVCKIYMTIFFLEEQFAKLNRK